MTAPRAARPALATLFFVWLYGAPFLLIIGLIRRGDDKAFATVQANVDFTARTDHLITAAIVLDLAAPVAGLAVALLCKDRYWKPLYQAALGWMLLVWLGYAVVNTGVAPPPPPPAYTPSSHCVAYSGGINTCPGG